MATPSVGHSGRILAGAALVAALLLAAYSLSRRAPPPAPATQAPRPPAPARSAPAQVRPISQPQEAQGDLATAAPLSPADAEERIVDQLLMDADAAFERADLEVASHLFQSIIDEHPDSKFAPYAAYKLAWCRFNEGDRPEAIRSLELLATWLQTSEVPGQKELLEATHKDLERFRTTDDEPIAPATEEDP